ncbi:hypothetical protein BESB_080400 [Besnoitia besnoiti]|uniref:Protein kinase domain-containing protein n=1 Tax=Besnoitia besnoiti TaxID=94643 RepID=A0A2A9M9E7_BESBE|nr:hypothetical protein BESB_080400 [Besnoitia besnoiti]PFH33824.1 hypothetical protein BESB_080400 [Besnoitia besnoiti]
MLRFTRFLEIIARSGRSCITDERQFKVFRAFVPAFATSQSCVTFTIKYGEQTTTTFPESILLGRGITARIDTSRRLGQGGYGVVYVGSCSPSGQRVAIKVVQCQQQVLLLLDRVRRYQLEQRRADWLSESSTDTNSSSYSLPAAEVDDDTRKDSTESYGGATSATIETTPRGEPLPAKDVMRALAPHPILPSPSSMSACEESDFAETATEGEARQEDTFAGSESEIEIEPAAVATQENTQEDGGCLEQGEGNPSSTQEAQELQQEQKEDEASISTELKTNADGEPSKAPTRVPPRGAAFSRNRKGSTALDSPRSSSLQAMFESAHLLRVYGIYPCLQSSRLFTVMERLEGPPLRAHLLEEYSETLPTEEEAFQIVFPVLKGLQEIHERGLRGNFDRTRSSMGFNVVAHILVGGGENRQGTQLHVSGSSGEAELLCKRNPLRWACAPPPARYGTGAQCGCSRAGEQVETGSNALKGGSGFRNYALGKESVRTACRRCPACVGYAFTPQCIPYEALVEKKVSPWVDVYAVGCLLYLLVEGCFPHEPVNVARYRIADATEALQHPWIVHMARLLEEKQEETNRELDDADSKELAEEMEEADDAAEQEGGCKGPNVPNSESTDEHASYELRDEDYTTKPPKTGAVTEPSRPCFHPVESASELPDQAAAAEVEHTERPGVMEQSTQEEGEASEENHPEFSSEECLSQEQKTVGSAAPLSTPVAEARGEENGGIDIIGGIVDFIVRFAVGDESRRRLLEERWRQEEDRERALAK